MCIRRVGAKNSLLSLSKEIRGWETVHGMKQLLKRGGQINREGGGSNY